MRTIVRKTVRREVVLRSDLVISSERYNQAMGEITVRGDIAYSKNNYGNIPIVRILIECDEYDERNFSLCDEEQWFVSDEFFPLLPYLKPVAKFRRMLINDLSKFVAVKSQSDFFRIGLTKYIKELETFSDLKSLVSQAKGSVNRLRPDQKDAELISRKIIEALGMSPQIDTIFEKEVVH